MICKKCNDTGWYSYDHNHGAKCDECCEHNLGWWLLEEHYGDDNGKLCCMNGCGTTKDIGDNWIYKVTKDALKKDLR